MIFSLIQQLNDSVDTSTLLVWVVVALLVGVILLNFRSERRIKALGGHAPILKSYAPFGLDIVYNTITETANFRDIKWWEGCFQSKNSRTVEAYLGGMRMIFTDEPENIKAILATQFEDYGKGPRFHHEWKDFLGDSIFTTDEQLWRDSRALIRPQFIKERVSDLETFDHHVTELLTHVKGGQIVDIEDLVFRMTLDVATKFLLGKSVGALQDSRTEFAAAFNEIQHIQNFASRVGPVVYPFLPKRKFNAALKVLNSFVTPFIERTLALSEIELEETVKSSPNYTFLHALASYTRDPKVIRDQLVAVLLAGRDTTAGTLSWAVLELSRNPTAITKLRDEILSTVGPTRAPTYRDLKDMRYLNAVISETLRLYPSVPGNMRTALKDTTLPRGGGKNGSQPVGVPKGTPVLYSPLVMQRRESLYPADARSPSEFHPERWEKWTPTPWTYIPFNGGPRICVGQQFALAEVGYTLVKIFQRFDSVRWVGKEEDVRLRCEIVIRPSQAVDVVFHEAEVSKET